MLDYSFFMKRKKKWRKILYEDQGYEDNYVHSSFMSSLLTNFGIKYKYSHVCHSVLCVNHQIIVVLFLLLAYHCIDKNIASNRLIYAANITIIILKEVLIYQVHKSIKCSFKNILDTIIIIGIIWILSPVLISLTQTHSDNTVYLVSILLLLIHLMFHNYGFIYEKNENIDIFDSTSLSCAVIASVILGSRLASIEQLKNIKYYNYVLFPLMFLIVSLCIRSISTILFYLNFFGHIFLIFVVPAFFVRKHNLKTKLEGPWDICAFPSTTNKKTQG
ncbi:hypothetical protein AK88_00841 [Plasmodium fragile]|uniref:Phosphatidylinositol N-acetylglucosaminyltransferase n=1 Tax=Plasmodium fragile TaxID=5857 RepID=A0A0D9QR31_PLAFR|nr:uncharacterized protein AK88_00841 [Plasmodium fragile]KJP89398.1 hypothetical protein AK88_00841 [Plasmodium fragile]